MTYCRPLKNFCRIVFLILAFTGTAFGGGFDRLSALDRKQWIAGAENIYYGEVQFLSTSEAEAQLNSLAAFARREKYPELEIDAYTWLGNFYLDRQLDHEKLLSFYEEAHRLACKHGIKTAEAEVTYRMGIAYFRQKIFTRAFELLISADIMIREIGYDQFPEVNNFLLDIGRAYYDFADYRRAKEYFQEALKHPFTHSPNAIHIYNTLALSYSQLGDAQLSAEYFQKALTQAEEERDSAWIGIISGNLGNVYFRQGAYDKAMPLLQTDYRLSVKNQQWNSAAGSLLLMAEILMKSDSLDAAARMISEAEAYSREMHPKWLYRDIYRRKAMLYFHRGDYKAAYFAQDTFMLYRDSVIVAQDKDLLKQAEVKVSTEKYLAERELRESERHKQRLMVNGSAVIFVLALLVFYLLYNRQQLRRKKDREIFLLEKRRFEEELDNSRHRLHAYMDNLREKNQLIEKFKTDMQNMQNLPEPLPEEKEEMIDKLYHSAILTEEDWNEFRRLFEKVHTDFFEKLRQKFPDLTLAETRLLALTKLKLSVNEMAHMLGISPNSVRKTSLRLRKKLRLENPDGLFDLVAGL